MRYLGIDFGGKRVGIAVSDETGKMAFPYTVIPNNQNLLREIEEVIKKEGIDRVVMGESKNFKGKPNRIMREIGAFKKRLEEEAKLRVHFESEFMTSVQAKHIQGENEMHDASAASIILQSYLDRNQHML